MSASQFCKKILRKRAIKVRNREILQYSVTKFIAINLSNIFLLISIKLPLTGAKSKTLTCYIENVETVKYCHKNFPLERGSFQAKAAACINT